VGLKREKERDAPMSGGRGRGKVKKQTQEVGLKRVKERDAPSESGRGRGKEAKETNAVGAKQENEISKPSASGRGSALKEIRTVCSQTFHNSLYKFIDQRPVSVI